MLEAPVRLKLTVDEFIRLYDQEGPFEIIKGERIKKMPTIAGHSAAASNFYDALLIFLKTNPLGKVMIETTFVLPDTALTNWVEGSRIPDVMFITAERLDEYKTQTPDWQLKPYMLVPDIVVEVVSPNDRYSDIHDKVTLYLADGVKIVLILDPQRKTVAIHPKGSDYQINLSGDNLLTFENLLPGFEISISSLFE